MRRLLVLRPEPGASATVARARARGLDAVSVPLFSIEQVEWQAPDPSGFNGLLLTSANAVRFGGEQLRILLDLPVYVVGKATAEAAHEAGLTVAATGEAGIDALLESIEPNLKLLHLSGEYRREPGRPRQAIIAITVYRAVPVEAPDLSSAPGTVALIHSPRAGRRFAELIGERSNIVVAAISAAAANAVGDGWQAVAAAEQPTDDALLALAASLCDKPDPK